MLYNFNLIWKWGKSERRWIAFWSVKYMMWWNIQHQPVYNSRRHSFFTVDLLSTDYRMKNDRIDEVYSIRVYLFRKGKMYSIRQQRNEIRKKHGQNICDSSICVVMRMVFRTRFFISHSFNFSSHFLYHVGSWTQKFYAQIAILQLIILIFQYAYSYIWLCRF